jgi:hypothetical protein
MIVVRELDPCLGGRFARLVELISDLLHAPRLLAELLVDPRTDYVFVSNDMGGIQCFRQFVFDNVVADVARWRLKPILVENGANILRGMVEVSRKFDFLISNLGDLRDGAFKIGFHGVSDGIQLNSYPFDSVFRSQC